MESVALVTGCSSGIGLETAIALGREGHFTYATMRDVKKSGSLDKIVNDEGLPIKVLELDVDSEKSVDDWVVLIDDPVQELSDFDITSVGNYLTPVLKDKQENLHSRLEQYDSEEHENEHVHKRNLQTFAEVNKYIEDILNYIKEPDAKPQGLLMKLVKDKL